MSDYIEKAINFTNKSIIYNRFYKIFRNFLTYSPIIFLMVYFLTLNLWVIGIAIISLIIFWLISVKLKSLRNINFYAAKECRRIHNDNVKEEYNMK